MRRKVPWKAEWKAAGLDPGPLTAEEESMVPQLRVENDKFLARHPFRRKNTVPWSVWALPLAAALVLALPFAVPGSGAERVKGAAPGLSLALYRQTASGTETLKPGQSAYPGDVLQASYRVDRVREGLLVSVDGSGNLTVHLGRDGHSVPLVAGKEQALPTSYELDAAPRYETFELLVSDRPFTLEAVRSKLLDWTTLTPSALGNGFDVIVFPLKKETRT